MPQAPEISPLSRLPVPVPMSVLTCSDWNGDEHRLTVGPWARQQ